MSFKVGDKVILTNIENWYGGELSHNDKCTVIKVGLQSPDTILWVCNTNEILRAIYSSWASPALRKGQQLEFSFMSDMDNT